MNVAEIRARVQARVGDTSGAEITAAQVLMWINDGAQEIARRAQQPQATATTVTVAGQSTYSISTFAADVLRMRSVMHDGSVLQAISQEEADRLLADRENAQVAAAASGTPQWFWLWADQLNLWPRPGTSGKQLKLFYVKRPAAVTTDSDVPNVPLHMHTDLVEYVYAQVLETTGAGERAERARDRFDAGATAAAADAEWPQRNVYPHVSVAIDDTWWA